MKYEGRKTRMDARRIDASESAEQMSGLNPDEMDGEKRGTKVPRTRRRKSQPALWWSRLEFREIELSGNRESEC